MSDLSNLIDSFTEHQEDIKTVYDNLSWMWKPRETIVETPRAGWPEGTNSAPTNNTIDKAADVITLGTNFYTQLKGLFGLGYPATETQPVSPVKHEVTQGGLQTVTGVNNTTLLIAGAVLLLLLMK